MASGFGTPTSSYYNTNPYGTVGTNSPTTTTTQNYYTSLPPLPTIPQYPTNPYLSNFNDIISKMLNFNYWQQLPPNVLQLIEGQKQAALQGFDVQTQKLGDQLLTRLFGSGFQRSSVANEESQQLADERAAARGSVGAQYDSSILGAMGQAGQAGLSALTGAGGVAGTAGGLFNQGSSSYYNALVQSLMSQYGNQSQQYFGDRSFIEQIISQILNQLIGQIGFTGNYTGGGVG